MRGIQLIYVSTNGATQEPDDLVKDLENWFEDHRHLCRLMTTASPQSAGQVGGDAERSIEKISASLESGQRIFGRLKHSVQNKELARLTHSPNEGRIPLSGMNRFDDTRSAAHTTGPSLPASAKRESVTQPQMSVNLAPNFVALTNQSTVENPRVLPSRTYLKKNSSKS